MQQSTTGPQPYSSIPGVDPYVDWAFGAGSSFFVVVVNGRELLPVLIETTGVSARSLAHDEWGASIQISPLYIEPPAGLESAIYFTALVTREFFNMLLNNEKLKKQIARVAVGPPLRAEAPPDSVPTPAAERA